MIREESLRKKGWSERDIKKAVGILSEKRNVFLTDRFAPYIYWSALLVTIVGNFFISVALLPFFLYLSDMAMFFVVALLAIAFGSLFNILLKDIEMTDPKHHVIVGIFLPIFILINMYIMVDVARHIVRSSAEAAAALQSPLLIAIVYAAAFTVPIIMGRLATKKKFLNPA